MVSAWSWQDPGFDSMHQSQTNSKQMEIGLVLMTIVSKASQMRKYQQSLPLFFHPLQLPPLAASCFPQALPHAHTLSNQLYNLNPYVFFVLLSQTFQIHATVEYMALGVGVFSRVMCVIACSSTSLFLLYLF